MTSNQLFRKYVGEEERLLRWKRQDIVEKEMLQFKLVVLVTCEEKDDVPSSLAQHLAHIFRALRMDCLRRKQSDIATVLQASRR